MNILIRGMTLAATALILGLSPAIAVGPITDEQKASLDFSNVLSERVVERIFNEHTIAERKRIQTTLQDIGLYETEADGVFGPATMDGIVEKAWKISYETKNQVFIVGSRDAREFFSSLLEMSSEPPSAATQEAMFFVGDWNCGHMRVSLSERSYSVSHGSQRTSGEMNYDGSHEGMHFLELHGYGNFMIERSGANMIVLDSTDGADALCRPARG